MICMHSQNTANLIVSFSASLLVHFALLSIALPVGQPASTPASSLVLNVALSPSQSSSLQDMSNNSISLTDSFGFETKAAPEKATRQNAYNQASKLATEQIDKREHHESGIVFETPFQPFYPLHLLNKGTRGHVTVQLQVSEDGSFRDIEIIDSAPAGAFDNEVLRALQTARLRPKAVQFNQRYVLSIVFEPGAIGSTHKLIEQK